MKHYNILSGRNSLPEPLTEKEEERVLELLALGYETEARKTLIERNLRLAYHIAKKFTLVLPIDDGFSLGCIGLVKAANTFDVHKNIKFATYSSKCIENEILMDIRRNKKHSKVASLEAPIVVDFEKNLSTHIKDVIADPINLCDQFEAQSLISSVLTIALNHMKYRDLATILYDISGMGQNEIASKMSWSQSYVSRRLKKAHKILINLTKDPLLFQKENNITFSYLEDKLFSVKFLKKGVLINIEKRWADFFRDYPLAIMIQKDSHFLEICTDDRIFVLLADFLLYLNT